MVDIVNHSTVHTMQPEPLEGQQPRKLAIPEYSQLPRVPNMPQGCTWGLWDRPGHFDELGTLNLLTPPTVLSAKDEIQHGISVAVNWSLNNCQTPHSNRKPPTHTIIPLPDWVGHDDEIHMNTQSGSQWDGFRECCSHPLDLSTITDIMANGTQDIGLINPPRPTTMVSRMTRSQILLPRDPEMELTVRTSFVVIGPD